MRTGAMLMIVSAGVITACDTGDGTTLRAPDPDAPPATDVPITPTTLDGTGGIDQGGDTPADDSATLPAPIPSPVELFAPWADGGVIDPEYGCDGANASPALGWTGIPDGTAELAVTMVDDTNAPGDAPVVHWAMWGLDPALTGLDENEVPPGAFLALNSFGTNAYEGPCPDPGSTDVLRITVHALFQQLELADGTPAADVIDTIELLSIGEASVVGSATR